MGAIADTQNSFGFLFLCKIMFEQFLLQESMYACP